MPENIPAQEALERLLEGNRRFASNVRSVESIASQARRAELVAGQSPFAIILGCSDSRAPAELIFDQGLGDLFVIRVAGNIAAPSGIASVEFAAQRFGTRLVVVMGHSRCGAVEATIDSLLSPPQAAGQGNLSSIVSRIRPAVEGLLATELRGDRERLLGAAVRSNVRASVNHLRHGSRLLEQLIAEEGLQVVGAEYRLETGEVEIIDRP
jgi:carbonic anhydrase